MCSSDLDVHFLCKLGDGLACELTAVLLHHTQIRGAEQPLSKLFPYAAMRWWLHTLTDQGSAAERSLAPGISGPVLLH